MFECCLFDFHESSIARHILSLLTQPIELSSPQYFAVFVQVGMEFYDYFPSQQLASKRRVPINDAINGHSRIFF